MERKNTAHVRPKARGDSRAQASDFKSDTDRQEQTRGFVPLTDPRMRTQVEALRKELSTSPDKARELLQKAGILNRSGNLSKRFGG